MMVVAVAVAGLAPTAIVAASAEPASATFTPPSPGTLKALKGGYRNPASDTAVDYALPLSGAWLEHDTASGFPSPVMFPAATDLLGAVTAPVAGGTHYVREQAAPSGWRLLSQLGWDGATRNYTAEATVNGGTSTASIGGRSSRFVNALQNPTLPSECGQGLKVLLLLDRSGSTEPYKTDYAKAAKTFVSTLADTPTTLKITSFADTVQSGNGTSYDLSDAGDRAAADTKIDSVYASPSGATNWDEALHDAAGAGVDVVVFITDGNPTVRKGNLSGGGSTEIDDITFGIASANSAKDPNGTPGSGDEQTMLGVGVGAVSIPNLSAVSGLTEGTDYTTASDPTELAAVLKEIATKLCGGTIKIDKKLVPSADPGLFDLQIDGVTKSPAGGVGDAGTTGKIEAPAGDHTVSEAINPASPTVLVDYSRSIECRNAAGDIVGSGGKITVDPDAAITCLITNTRLGSVTVRKATDPVGSSQEFAFTGDPAGGAFGLVDGGSKAVDGLEPGSYSFTESVPSGWDLSDVSCKGTAAKPSVDLATGKLTVDLAAGENADCTFTNTQEGRIEIAKTTDPTGSSQEFGFTGPEKDGTFSLTDGKDKGFDLAPGKYSVEELATAGWDLSDLSCKDPSGGTTTDGAVASIDLAAGETVSCTYANTERAEVTIAKTTDPSTATDRFSFTGPGDPPVAFDLANGESKSLTDLAPGKSQSFSESVPSGWDLKSIECIGTDKENVTVDVASGAVTVTPQAGEDVTCTYANTQRGSITVRKKTDPAGSEQEFAFSGDPVGGSFDLADGGSKSFDSLTAGSYSFSETVPAGWDLTEIACTGTATKPVVDGAKVTISLAAGENADCTYTNTKQGEGTLVIKKATVQPGGGALFNFAGSDQIGDFSLLSGGSKSFTLPVGSYTVDEAGTTPASPSWSPTSIVCDDPAGVPGASGVAVSVTSGKTVTCTFTNALDNPLADISGKSRIVGTTGCAHGRYAYAQIAGTLIVKVTWYVNHKPYRTLTRPNYKGRYYRLDLRLSKLHRRYYAITGVVNYVPASKPPRSVKHRTAFRICTRLVSTG